MNLLRLLVIVDLEGFKVRICKAAAILLQLNGHRRPKYGQAAIQANDLLLM